MAVEVGAGRIAEIRYAARPLPVLADELAFVAGADDRIVALPEKRRSLYEAAGVAVRHSRSLEVKAEVVQL
jgi:hypothetical protein